MSTTPRLPSAVDGLPADFATVLAHQPELAHGFREVYGRFWSQGVLDHPTKETVRMRNARTTDCGYCRNVRFATAREQGLGEDLVTEIDDDWRQSELSSRAKAALGFADAYLEERPLEPALRAQLAAEFDPAEREELGIAMALFHGFSKLLISLGCEPEEMDTTVLATPGT